MHKNVTWLYPVAYSIVGLASTRVTPLNIVIIRGAKSNLKQNKIK